MQAVQFGMWVGRQEVLTMALGNSMTTVPAATNMHYRIGGITWTFQSTLLLMLAEQGRIRLDDTIARWYPNLLSADKITIRIVGCQYGWLPRLCERQDPPAGRAGKSLSQLYA